MKKRPLPSFPSLHTSNGTLCGTKSLKMHSSSHVTAVTATYHSTDGQYDQTDKEPMTMMTMMMMLGWNCVLCSPVCVYGWFRCDVSGDILILFSSRCQQITSKDQNQGTLVAHLSVQSKYGGWVLSSSPVLIPTCGPLLCVVHCDNIKLKN